ncbi:MAG: pyridoxal phosphate-dependent aminotransferase [Gammaproteobacteria bacterium]|nr:pyridoxal phosphate-dependent aminotransferase [Gammaproteobacteria bacterium]
MSMSHKGQSVNAIRDSIVNLPLSPTLKANQAGVAARASGKRVLQMGFGQSPFPVHPALARALADHAGHNSYDHVAGLAELRESALHYFADRNGVDSSQFDVIVGPGSKLILYALQMAISGDLIVPVPSWVSYAPQAAMLGDQVVSVPASLTPAGYQLEPDSLLSAIHRARSRGYNPTKLILNSPNNPTGLCMPPADYPPLVDVCRREGIFIISDEIYSLVTFDGTLESIASLHPAGSAVTTGLSKYLSLGGWRVGFGLIPTGYAGLFDAVSAIASETWSGVSAPVQRAAMLAVAGQPDIEAHVDLCTRIHGAVARAVAARLAEGGIHCLEPQGAFYLWPDFGPMRKRLKQRGITTSESLSEALLAERGVLSLPGTAFGAPPEALALRLSVCDYDGAAALEMCREYSDPANLVEAFAPRVDAAARAIAAFVQE